MTIEESLTGYADPVVWLVLAAFFISRGMIKTGLGQKTWPRGTSPEPLDLLRNSELLLPDGIQSLQLGRADTRDAVLLIVAQPGLL